MASGDTMNCWKKIVTVGLLLALLLPAAGCQDEGKMEGAGKAMDQMVQDAEDSLNDAVSETKRKFGFHEPGPVERTVGESGRAIDELIWSAEDWVDDTISDAKKFIDGIQK